MRTFASDNFSSVDPRIFDYLQDVNEQGHMVSYDGDQVTEAARHEFRTAFEADVSVLFTPAGTGANILALSLLREHPYDAVVTTEVSHIYEEETGALAATQGAQIIALPHEHGKLSAQTLAGDIAMRLALDFHSPLPKVVSIANSNEFGLVYSPDETRELADVCHQNDMYLHVDGCRLPNAAAALGVSLADLTTHAGVDVLTFGGAKNGLMNAESVVLFGEPKHSLLHMQKMNLQLVSKMRYLSGQFVPYLRDNIWFENAEHANTLARRLADGLSGVLPNCEFTRPVQTNQVFMKMDDATKGKLRPAHTFYDWNSPGEVRLVTAWDNTDADVDDLIAACR